jgi:hypothetical protein
MKLAAIYNVWDASELLSGSINCIKDHVDEIIIVFQNISNFGEVHYPFIDVGLWNPLCFKIKAIEYQPYPNKGKENEIKKRNIGLDKARELGCTHFLHMDCDEYYREFARAKDLFILSDKKGSVCRLNTYFKKPTLCLDRPEDYFVPFIHELRADTEAGVRKYPFYVDPTRKINETDVIELPIFMDHYSWVRKDINRKIRNSTARKNLMNNTYKDDYDRDLKAGDYIKCYDRKLTEVPDYFNINSMI